jgi:MFS family permease
MLLLLVHALLTQTITFVLRPAAAYRAIELDVPAAWLGVMTASFAVVPLFLAVPSGQAVDRFGERRVMVAGSVLLVGAGTLFLLGSAGPAGLVLATAVLGTGHLLSVVAEQAAVANSTAEGSFDSAFGYYTFAASLGQAIGPGLILLAGGDQAIPSTTVLFAIATGLAGVLVVSSALVRGSGGRRRQRSAGERGAMATLLRLPGLPRALLISSVVLAAVDITLVYLPALGADRGLAAGFVGLLLTMRAAASMTSRLFLGRLSALLGRRRLMIISVWLSAVTMASVGLPLPAWATAAIVVGLGLGLGVGQPLTMSWLAEMAPADLRGRAMSLRLTGNRLGQVVIPSAVGVFAVGVGAAGVLGVTAAALAGVALAARKLHPGAAHAVARSGPAATTEPAAGSVPDEQVDRRAAGDRPA